MRPSLGEDVLTSADLERTRPGSDVRVAGVVVARQRPATAKGITFMLLEDEHGTLNLIVPVPVYERCRLAVRAEPLLVADGKLERRDGVTNILVSSVRRLERPGLPLGEVRHIEPRRTWSSEESEGDLRAVMPAANSFGRGRG
jgi:error-prone DNA polymerase